MTRLDWHLVSWNSDLAGQLSLDPRDLRPQVAILVGQPLSECFHRDLDHSVYFVLYDWGRKSVTKMTRINKRKRLQQLWILMGILWSEGWDLEEGIGRLCRCSAALKICTEKLFFVLIYFPRSKKWEESLLAFEDVSRWLYICVRTIQF